MTNFRTALPLSAPQFFLYLLLTFSKCTHRIIIKKQLEKDWKLLKETSLMRLQQVNSFAR